MTDENSDYLKKQLITYIGNKRKLLPLIQQGIEIVQSRLNKSKLDLLDGFAGSGVVSRFLKKDANLLLSNDIEPYAHIIGLCYLANKSNVPFNKITAINAKLNDNKLLFSRSKKILQDIYAPVNETAIVESDRVFYTRENAKIIDNIRAMIDGLSESLQNFFLAPLLSEASIHANTSGVFKGFYKNADGVGQFGGTARNCLERITGQITLPLPIFSNFECDWKMYNSDINTLIKSLQPLDVVYYDPPYNLHPYGSNYFMLNVIVKNEVPQDLSKVSGIPKDWQKSDYNRKAPAIKAFHDLLTHTNSKFILMSYNDEGILNREEMSELVGKYGTFQIIEQEYSTFRASRNLANRNKTVKELLWVIEKK